MEPIFKKRDGYRRIYIDLPGMGQTEDYGHIHSSNDILDAVINFIETLIPNQAFMIAGESYGGYLTRGIIKRKKEQVLGTAFICPVIIPKTENRTLPKQTIVYSDHEFLSTLTNEEVDIFKANQVILDEYNWKRYRDEVLSGCKIADVAFLEKIQRNYGFSYSVDDVVFHKPSVFLLGKQDSVVGYKDAFELLDNYPRATFAVLDRAGHNLQIEQSHLFYTLINEWLDRIEEFIQ